MKRLLVAVIVLGLFVNVFDPSSADSVSIPLIVADEPKMTVTLDAVPTLSAAAYSVIDIETGTVLFSKNADQPLPIASVTKLFTAARTLESVSTEVTITDSDVASEGKAGKLEVGQSYNTRELLFPLLLESSNDAAAALGRVLGQPSFPALDLVEPSGLSSANRAAATELSSALRSLYQAHPHLFDITKLSQYVGKETVWVNNSPVHDLPGYQGGKHGYTEAAGRTLAAVFTEPTIDDRAFGYVILGSTDIKADTITLRDTVARSVRFQ